LKRMDSRSQMVFFHHCFLQLILTRSSWLNLGVFF
jgi:hypothetical protein